MHLYYLFPKTTEWTKLDEALLAYVAPERREKIRAYRFSKDRKLSLYAALLLPFACTDQYDLPFGEVDPSWPQIGKPVLQRHPEIHFSIAHSGSCSAVAVSDEEIGLDAELIAKAPMKALKRAFSSEESKQILSSEDPNLEFYRIWTRKEAYGKYMGTGLSSNVLKTNSLLPEHSKRIKEGIITPTTTMTKEGFTDALVKAGGVPSDDLSSALYYTVYGKETPLELTRVSETALLEYFLLYV